MSCVPSITITRLQRSSQLAGEPPALSSIDRPHHHAADIKLEIPAFALVHRVEVPQQRVCHVLGLPSAAGLILETMPPRVRRETLRGVFLCRRAGLPCCVGGTPRQAVRPLRAQEQHRGVPPPCRPDHGSEALSVGAPRVPDCRQRQPTGRQAIQVELHPPRPAQTPHQAQKVPPLCRRVPAT